MDKTPEPFEQYPALASWIERLGNSGLNISLGDWMVFIGALNQALIAAARPAVVSDEVVSALEFICNGPRDADMSYRELFMEDCERARAALALLPGREGFIPILAIADGPRAAVTDALRSGGQVMTYDEAEAQADLEAMKALLIARAEEPERVARRREYQAFFDAAMDTLRKGTPGLTDQTRVVLARSIALKCQSVLRELS